MFSLLSLRHGSIFKRDRASACSLQDALFCILAWCQQMPVEIAGELLDLDDSIVMVWYHRCRAAVNEYMQRKFQSKFIFGGEGSVVLLDLAKTIPPSTLKHDSRRKYRDRFRTLYIADTNHIPVRNWVHILPSFRKPEKLFQIYRSRISSSDCNTIAQHNIVTQKVESEKTNEDGETQNCFAVDIDAVTSPNGFTNTSNSSPDHRKLRILKEQQDLNETRVVLTDICSKTQRNIPEEQIKKKDERTLSTDLAMCVQEECSQFELESHPIKEIENLNMFNEVEAYLRKLECTDFVLKSVKHLIAPGSFVVANEAALPNICEALRKAGRYEAVVSFSEIGCIDEEGHRPTKAILDRLFQPANEHCFGSSTHGGANQRAAEFNWRQIFGMNTSYAAYHIMHIMGSYSS